MDQHQAVISGSIPLQILNNHWFESSDLDLFCPEATHEAVIALLASYGFNVQKTTPTEADLAYGDHFTNFERRVLRRSKESPSIDFLIAKTSSVSKWYVDCLPAI
jgi:hypothetical protein